MQQAFDRPIWSKVLASNIILYDCIRILDVLARSSTLLSPVSHTVIYSLYMHEHAHCKFACWRAKRASNFLMNLSKSGGQNRLTAVPQKVVPTGPRTSQQQYTQYLPYCCLLNRFTYVPWQYSCLYRPDRLGSQLIESIICTVRLWYMQDPSILIQLGLVPY